MSAIVPYNPQPTTVVVRRRSNNKRRNQNVMNPSPTALVYRGPTRSIGALSSAKPVTVVVCNIGNVAASGAGVVATVFDSNVQLTASPQWTDYATLYSEFRLLSMDLTMIPWNKYYGPTTNVLPSIVSVIDRQGATALSSFANASGYVDSIKMHCASDKIHRTVKMSGTGESDWVSVASAPAAADRMYIKLYGSGFTNSINLFDYINFMVVQFRGAQ